MNDTPAPARWWGRLAGLILAGLFCVGVLTLLGARWSLNRYLTSDRFRQFVSQKTSAALRAQGEYLPVHWSGLTAYSDGFYAHGLPASPVQDIRLDQIRAELDWRGLLRRTCRISNLDIQRLQATLKSPTAAPELPRVEVPPAPSSVRVELDPIHIADANVVWPMGAVRRVRAVVTTGDSSWETTGTGGELTLSNWPTMKIGEFRIRSRDGAIFITDCRLNLDGGGTLAVSGQMQQDIDVRAECANVPIGNWLPPDWRGRLTGLAHGQGQLRGQFDNLTVTGLVALVGGKLEALPVLDRIALFTGTEQFRSVPLHKARAEFAWQQRRLIIRNLVLESTGLLRVEGGCVIEQDVVTGEFDVGVAPSTLRWLPGSRTRVFTLERDGYLWTRIKVTGPLRNLREDLSGRLIEAAGTEVFKGAKGTLEKGVQGLFDLLLP